MRAACFHVHVKRALDASPDFPLALRCLIHLSFATPMKSSGGRATALSYAKRLAEVQPIAGLGVLGRVLLEDSKQAETAAQALKDCLLTVPLDREAAERAAIAAVAQCSGNVEVVMPGSVMAGPSLVSSAKPRRVPVAFPRMWVSTHHAPPLTRTRIKSLAACWRSLHTHQNTNARGAVRSRCEEDVVTTSVTAHDGSRGVYACETCGSTEP